MTTKHNIKLGVSLYSYQEEYFLGKVTLEGAIAKSAQMGALGIETIAEQMMPGFPHLSNEFYEMWHEWMAKYGTVPTAHDMFADTKLHKDRLLTNEELIDELNDDIRHANRLGCTVIRILVTTPPEVVEAAAPFAIERGVRLCTEVHAPFYFEHEHIQRHLEVAERIGSKYIGLTPDLGIFTKRFPRVQADRARRDGVPDEMVDFIVKKYESGEADQSLLKEVKKRGGGSTAVALAGAAARYLFIDPKAMLDYLPYIHHIHAKFYEMLDDGTEYSIPYDEILSVLIEGGYDGYMSSEYEGNRHIQDAYEVDSFEQVRRHQQMMARLLGETPA